ncbi:hypothetical protein SeLEV6574_g06725 [Synchytrium endobioticum]|uniref:Uncharacterized protein n=1 Tax=Synchytrium endobioticum TaxID=286115 RepID=A0A507CMS4_9FUNG|nr:hypothetical protein SeLEV6574_g06725 [Synchytrium endobioticum]
MGRAPRPRWVRRDGRLVRIDGAEETHIVEERQRHPANRMEAHGDQEAADAGNAAKSLPPPPLPQSPPLRLLPWESSSSTTTKKSKTIRRRTKIEKARFFIHDTPNISLRLKTDPSLQAPPLPIYQLTPHLLLQLCYLSDPVSAHLPVLLPQPRILQQ